MLNFLLVCRHLVARDPYRPKPSSGSKQPYLPIPTSLHVQARRDDEYVFCPAPLIYNKRWDMFGRSLVARHGEVQGHTHIVIEPIQTSHRRRSDEYVPCPAPLIYNKLWDIFDRSLVARHGVMVGHSHVVIESIPYSHHRRNDEW
jgi:hypothetical protein